MSKLIEEKMNEFVNSIIAVLHDNVEVDQDGTWIHESGLEQDLVKVIQQIQQARDEEIIEKLAGLENKHASPEGWINTMEVGYKDGIIEAINLIKSLSNKRK